MGALNPTPGDQAMTDNLLSLAERCEGVVRCGGLLRSHEWQSSVCRPQRADTDALKHRRSPSPIAASLSTCNGRCATRATCIARINSNDGIFRTSEGERARCTPSRRCSLVGLKRRSPKPGSQVRILPPSPFPVRLTVGRWPLKPDHDGEPATSQSRSPPTKP